MYLSSNLAKFYWQNFSLSKLAHQILRSKNRHYSVGLKNPFHPQNLEMGKLNHKYWIGMYLLSNLSKFYWQNLQIIHWANWLIRSVVANTFIWLYTGIIFLVRTTPIRYTLIASLIFPSSCTLADILLILYIFNTNPMHTFWTKT